MPFLSRLRHVLAILVAAGSAGCAATPGRSPSSVDHVILLVADGAGYNTWLATAMYEGDASAATPGDEWVHVACDTYALRDDQADAADPDGAEQDPTFVYDPARAWDTTPVEGERDEYPFFFEGYRWLRRAPDSANTATAMSTGRRTYSGAINADAYGQPLEPTIASLTRLSGRAVGIVTSVPLSHATPAALAGAHHESRGAYASLARQMLASTRLDFLAGCGNPDFDAAGRPVAAPDGAAYVWVGGAEVWRRLGGREPPAERVPQHERALHDEEIRDLSRWTLVQSRGDIERLLTGELPERPLIVPQVRLTLQQGRDARADPRNTEPFAEPPLDTVPDLPTLTRVALRSLGSNSRGFFLHVEGGAVDWAMHGNQMGRMIEEMIDFRRAIEAVEEWVEANSDWSRALVIVTSDHDHLLAGPDADTLAFAPLVDRGEGRMPGHLWLADEHSNALVPLFARGAGAEAFRNSHDGNDPVHGPYVAQTRIFDVLARSLGTATP